MDVWPQIMHSIMLALLTNIMNELVKHKIGVIVAMVFRAFLLLNTIFIIAKALCTVFN